MATEKPTDRDRLGAIALALVMRPISNQNDMLDVIGRLVRDVYVDPDATEPTRLLVEAIRTEKGRHV